MEKTDAEKEKSMFQAFKNVNRAVNLLTSAAAETKQSRRAHVAKLQREDSVLKDFHIMEKVPSYKKLEQEGQAEAEASKSKSVGGFMAKMGAKNAKDVFSLISSSESVASLSRVESAETSTKKIKKEKPRFVHCLKCIVSK